MDYIFMALVNVLSVVVGLLTFNFIKEFPTYFNNKKLQKSDHDNQRMLQQEAFYKELSGEKLEDLLNEFSSYIVDFDKLRNMDTDNVKFLTQQVFMYGSKRTNENYAKYTQLSYNPEKYEKMYSDDYQLLQLILFTNILTDLKYDFTGYYIEPATFLKAKVTDFNEKYTDEDIKKIYDIIDSM